MILCGYTLYDVKSMTYTPPFFCASDAVAVRTIQSTMISDPSCTIARFAEDFKLYLIGEFSDAAGSFTAHSTHTLVSDLLPIRESIVSRETKAEEDKSE